MIYKNREKYDGEWKNFLKEGKNIYYYNNSNEYEGKYKNNEIIKGKREVIFQNYIIYDYSIINNNEIYILNSCGKELKRKINW